MDKPTNEFKLAYRKLQSEFTQLKDHWLAAVWLHAQGVKADIQGAEAQIKHFLGVK